MQPFAHLQLESQDGAIIEHSPNLMSCGDVKTQASKLPGIMSLSFSSDGSKLAIGTGTWRNAESRGSVLLWDLNQQDNVMPLPGMKFDKTVDWVQFSDDGKYLAASSEDGTAETWSFSNGIPSNPTMFDPRLLIAPDQDRVGGSGAYAVALSSPAKHLMAIGYGDGHLVIYDLIHPSTPLYVGVAHVSGVMSLVFLEQKEKDMRLAVGSRDGDLLLMDPYGGAIKATLHTDQGVLQGLAAGYNDDTSKAWLLTSGSNGTVGLWAVSPNFHLLLTLRGHTKGVHAAEFCQTTQNPANENGCIVSVSSDRNMRLWKYPFRKQAGTHTHLAEGGLLFPGQLLGIAFRPGHDQRERIVTAVGATTEEKESREDTEAVATWDYRSNAPPEEFNRDPSVTEKPMLGFGASPDGKFMVSTSRNRDLVLIDLKSGLREPPILVHVTLKPKIKIRCFNSDGTRILPERVGDALGGCSANQREYFVMGVADRGDIADSADVKGDRYGPGSGLCWWRIIDRGTSQKPRFSITDRDFNSCESPVTGSRKRSPQPSDIRDVGMFDISGDGKDVATSSDAGARTYVKIWKTADLLTSVASKPIYENGDNCESQASCGFDAQFADMIFSPDGNYLAATDIGQKMYFWRVLDTQRMPMTGTDDGRSGRNLPARGQALAFLPPEQDLPKNDTLFSKIRKAIPKFSSADEGILAIGLQDGGIVLWSTEDARRILEIRQQKGGILGLAFSPDGEALASSGNDGVVQVMHTAEVP
jgi:WD40 repeat protein